MHGAFRFLNVWKNHRDFLPGVKDNWDQPSEGTGMTQVINKLMRLKKYLLWWNINKFGNVSVRVKQAEDNLLK